MVLQWTITNDRIVLDPNGGYWEKYEDSTENLPGLYLRTDDITAFGDFLELNPDETFTREENETGTTGAWHVEEDEVVLTFP
jgi:hypothetical protein